MLNGTLQVRIFTRIQSPKLVLLWPSVYNWILNSDTKRHVSHCCMYANMQIVCLVRMCSVTSHTEHAGQLVFKILLSNEQMEANNIRVTNIVKDIYSDKHGRKQWQSQDKTKSKFSLQRGGGGTAHQQHLNVAEHESYVREQWIRQPAHGRSVKTEIRN